MKYILILIASSWLMSCSEEFAAPIPPAFISGTANNEIIDQNTVVNLRNGDSLVIELTMIIPNGLEDFRVEVSGINDGFISRINLTENAILNSSQGDSIYTNITIRQVVNDLESWPYVVGHTSQTYFTATLIDEDFLTTGAGFKVERQ